VPVVLLVVLLLAALAAPAAAHEADPRVVTQVEQIAPPLPEGVVVQAHAGVATQLVARNPTDVPLEVLARDERPFLRISVGGVLADVAHPEFLATSSPTGQVRGGAAGGAPARWVRISDGDSWGWYDHRLHPSRVAAPDDDRAGELGRFEVPLRYGDQPVRVQGTLAFRPLLGTFLPSADPAPQGLQVDVLPGRLPGLLLSVDADLPVTVLGREGEPFLRFTADGVEVNRNSRTHVEDRQARGEPAGPPSPTPDFRLVAPGSSSYTWLDSRLRYPDDVPPDAALRAAEPVVVQRWEVPVQVGARAAALTGDVTWVPQPGEAATGATRPDPEGAAAQGDGARATLLPYVLLAALGVVVLVVAVTLLLRRRARAA
jgi:hypothetical protein